MKLPVQVVFRNCPQSEALVNLIEKKTKQLERYFPRIMGCRVVVEVPHQHQHQGNLYRVFVDLTLPGNEIIVGRNHLLHESHQDVFVAVRDSFKAARRKLQDLVRRRRSQNKRVQAGASKGKIVELFPEGYGFIEGQDGRQVYFHRNSVINSQFDQMNVGSLVRFSEETGQEGPQASTVHLIGNELRHLCG